MSKKSSSQAFRANICPKRFEKQVNLTTHTFQDDIYFQTKKVYKYSFLRSPGKHEHTVHLENIFVGITVKILHVHFVFPVFLHHVFFTPFSQSSIGPSQTYRYAVSHTNMHWHMQGVHTFCHLFCFEDKIFIEVIAVPPRV